MIKLIIVSMLLITITECCDCVNKTKKSDRRLSKFFAAKSLPVDKPKRLKGHINKPMSNLGEFNEINEKTIQIQESQNESLEKLCVYSKNNEDLDFDKMVDVWEIVYYRSSMQLNCFKFIIRKVPIKTKKLNKIKYGDFNGTINWDRCELQVISNTKEPTAHYLQGDEHQKGILQNIIITEDIVDDKTTITLHDHSPNQWMVTNDLLSMRECDNGELLIFTRVPYQPQQRDIFEALLKFREEPSHPGKWACKAENNEFIKKFGSNIPQQTEVIQRRTLKRRKTHGNPSRRRYNSNTHKEQNQVEVNTLKTNFQS